MRSESEIEMMNFEHGGREGVISQRIWGANRAEKDKETRCRWRPHNEPAFTLQKPLLSNQLEQ